MLGSWVRAPSGSPEQEESPDFQGFFFLSIVCLFPQPILSLKHSLKKAIHYLKAINIYIMV
jgi:hypothetical protein